MSKIYDSGIERHKEISQTLNCRRVALRVLMRTIVALKRDTIGMTRKGGEAQTISILDMEQREKVV